MHSQSHYFGIETMSDFIGKRKNETLNRTILELKQAIALFFALAMSLSIALFWN